MAHLMPMTHSLTSAEWLRLQSCLHALYSEGLSAENYVERAMAAVLELVPGEFSTYSRALPGGFDVVFSNNNAPSMDVLMGYVQVKDGYELWKSDVAVRAGQPLFLRDYFSRRQFRDLDVWSLAYQKAGLSNHCAIPVAKEDGASLFFSVQRSGAAEFTEEERALLCLLQPHLRNARALARERTATGPMEVGELHGLGLTPREQEVFFWLMEGKRNPEIAHILKVRPDTVKSHVERIFQKLRVESRSAAMRHGFEHVQKLRRDEWRQVKPGKRVFFL